MNWCRDTYLVKILFLSIQDQRNGSLGFLLSHFCDAELRWSTTEKEGYIIMTTVDLMQIALNSRSRFRLSTDHNKFVFLFNPRAVVADVSQTTLRKGLRLKLWLSSYKCTYAHISGNDNAWEDFISCYKSLALIRHIISVPFLPSFSSKNAF